MLDFQDLGQRAQGWAYRLRVWDSRFEVIWSRKWDEAKRENYGGIATELYSYASHVGVLVAFVAELRSIHKPGDPGYPNGRPDDTMIPSSTELLTFTNVFRCSLQRAGQITMSFFER